MKRNQTPKIRVAIFDNDPLRLIGFRSLLEPEKDLELKIDGDIYLCSCAEVDVVVLRGRRDYNLAARVNKLTTATPGARILITGSNLDESDIVDALIAGAKGYVSETASGEEFARSIRVLHAGMMWAPRRLLAEVVKRISATLPGYRLAREQVITSRQKEVLQMLVAGRSNKEIAAPLGIEERTVKAHISQLMRKLGASNRIAVSVQAIRQSIVTL